MGFTLSNLLAAGYAALGELRVHTATGGGLASVQDERLYGAFPADAWAGGSLIALGSGAAPAGEWVPIGESRDVAGAPGYAEFIASRNFSAAITAGTPYGLLSAKYPLDTMIALANQALAGLGMLGFYATLTVQAGMANSLPGVTWNEAPPVGVEIGQGTGWASARAWQYLPPLPGIDGAVIFLDGARAGQSARVWSIGAHAVVAGHDDLIAPAVTPELATAALTVQALTWKRGGTQGLDASLDEHLADARRSLETARTRHPIWTPRRVGRLLTVGGSR